MTALIPELAPASLLAAYVQGIFPMAGESGDIRWFSPDPRAILPLDRFQTSRSLRAVVRRGRYRCTINEAFADVMAACADRDDGTWISDQIIAAYTLLHRAGFAHSIEAWQGDTLAGGLYGVSIGGAFFGESMFHRAPDASKVALVFLVERMRQRGLALLDIQFMTEHLRRFGAVEIPRQAYLRRLRAAVKKPASFVDSPDGGDRGRPD